VAPEEQRRLQDDAGDGHAGLKHAGGIQVLRKTAAAAVTTAASINVLGIKGFKHCSTAGNVNQSLCEGFYRFCYHK
jgi:hypothetical protein